MAGEADGEATGVGADRGGSVGSVGTGAAAIEGAAPAVAGPIDDGKPIPGVADAEAAWPDRVPVVAAAPPDPAGRPAPAPVVDALARDCIWLSREAMVAWREARAAPSC